MTRPLPVYVGAVVLVILAVGGGIGALRLVAAGNLVHALPSALVCGLSSVGAVGLILRRSWARIVCIYGFVVASASGVAGITYSVILAGPAMLLGLADAIVIATACLALALWLQFSEKAKAYFNAQ